MDIKKVHKAGKPESKPITEFAQGELMQSVENSDSTSYLYIRTASGCTRLCDGNNYISVDSWKMFPVPKGTKYEIIA